MEALQIYKPVAEQQEEYDYYQRKLNDTNTWLAEVLDGSMRTPFSYDFDGVELYADDGGAMGPIFWNSMKQASGFERRRCAMELREYNDMLAMMRGELPNTMVVVSDFPDELRRARADSGGYNVRRQQAMLRVIVRQGSKLHMFSQSLDGSDRQALEAVYGSLGFQAEPGELLGQRMHLQLDESRQNALTDDITRTYDDDLKRQYGGHFNAGRQESSFDTYAFVLSQQTVIERFVRKRMDMCATDDDRFDLAAWVSQRYEQYKQPVISYDVDPTNIIMQFFGEPHDYELHAAGTVARKAGKVFSGCGMSVSGARDQYETAGYGGSSDEDGPDGKGPLKFTCSNGHINTRPLGKLLKQCRVPSCKNSVAC